MYSYNIADPTVLNYGVKLPKFLTSSAGVYRLTQNPRPKLPPILEFKYKEYKLPPKLYGEIPKLADFFYEGFKRRGYQGGVMLTGEPGAGKTELAKIICNRAIKDGLRVIDLNNTRLTPEFIDYLETLDDVVLFFDEFGKIIPDRGQDKLLTLFSNPAGVKRIIIITENERFRINSFIRNRPGRIRYSKHFDKVPLSTVKDYLEDKNVDEDFYNDVINLYKRMPKFAFDHLQAIVDEYLMFPDLDFKEILEVLNLDFITGTKIVKPTKFMLDKIEFKIVDGNVSLIGFVEYSQRLILTVEVPEEVTKDKELMAVLTSESTGINNNFNNPNLMYNSGGMYMGQGQGPMLANNTESSSKLNVVTAKLDFTKENMKEFVDDKMFLTKANGRIQLETKVLLSYEDKDILNRNEPY